ncbi:T9SS type A sorting domain-containing protein [Epilithonimonas sp. UC225_85]|uniref:T9SS type A sorting domain-containing protein n=1 Tax=Epilithonimonas sp. UC225_85 TaxID=3350167 RepID=UPI0036D3B309
MKKILLSLALISLSISTNAQSWVDQGIKFAQYYYPSVISIVNANTVWATASDGSGGGTYPKVISKTTNGSTWTATNITGLTSQSTAMVSDLFALDATTAFLVTAPSSGTAGNGIYKTTNGGTSWTKQTGYSTSSFANQIHFWDANNGWTAGDPVGGKFEMYKTSNGGTTWTAVANTPAPINSDEYGYNLNNKYILGDNIWIGTSLGRILHSTDRGTTWAAYSTPVLDFAGNIVTGSSGTYAFKDGNNGLLIAVDGDVNAVLYSTTNGGANWEPVDATGTWYFGDITYVPGTANTYVTTGIYTDDTGVQGSAYSKDGGLTWVSIDAGLQRGTVKFLNPTTGWAGQFSDGPAGTEGILKFSGDLSLAVNETNAKSGLKVFPNPAVDVVNLTANKEIKSVTIYDLSGKKVKSTTDTKQINVSTLAKGTYILQAYYGSGGVENTKIIKK